MSRNNANFQFDIKPTPLARLLPISAWSFVAVMVTFGPFLLVAKVFFMLLWWVLGAVYWRKLNVTQHINQLRLESGNVILGFSHGQEAELVYLVGRQRVLPWFVELNILRENGKRTCWCIAKGALTRDEFRQLKIFVKGQCR